MIYLISTFSLLGFYNIAVNLNTFYYKSKTNIVQNIFTFTLLFYFVYLAISYLFIFEINSKNISVGIATISFLFGVSFFLKEHRFLILKIRTEYNHKLLLVAILSYFFISYLVPSDQDSIRYHMEIPKKIIENTFYINTTFDYMVIGANEFINLFGLHLNFENTGSLLSFAYIIFIILANSYFFQNYKVGSKYLGSILVISSPYLFALLSSQKIYLVPSFVVSYSIAYLFIAKKNILFKDMLIIIAISVFAFCLKSIFLPHLLLVLFWCVFICKLEKIKKIYIILFSFILLAISYFPLGLIKYKIYNDPFLPILSINPENNEWFKMFKFYLTNFQMDYTNNFSKFFQFLFVPLKLIMPLSPSDMFKTLGVGMAGLLLLPYKKNKMLVLIILFFILSFVALQNYQSRWLLCLLIFIGIFVENTRGNWLRKISDYQLILITLILIPFAFFTLASNAIPTIQKYNNFYAIKHISEEVNLKYKDIKYFTNSNYFYYHDNDIPIYYPEINSLFDKNFFQRNKEVKHFLFHGSSSNLSQYVSKGRFDFNNNFKFSSKDGIIINKPIETKNNTKPTCLNSEYEQIETWTFNSRRNFLFTEIAEWGLYRLC